MKAGAFLTKWNVSPPSTIGDPFTMVTLEMWLMHIKIISRSPFIPTWLCDTILIMEYKQELSIISVCSTVKPISERSKFRSDL